MMEYNRYLTFEMTIFKRNFQKNHYHFFMSQRCYIMFFYKKHYLTRNKYLIPQCSKSMFDVKKIPTLN